MQQFWNRLKGLVIAKNYEWKKYNFPLVFIVLILSCISVLTLWIIGSGHSQDANYKKQMIGILLGLFIMVFMSLVDYHFICRYVIVYYILVTGLVAATRFSPLGTNNDKDSYRWIKFPGFDLQPSELCKLMIILALAMLFYKLQNKLKTFFPLLASVLICIAPIAFILLQPDLSSSLVIVFILAMMLFASGIAYKILLPVIAVFIPVVITGFWYIMQPDQKLLKPYQVGRIVGFLDPDKYPNTMYQQNYSIDSIASGKLYGKFILGGISDVRSYNRVDVTESDFIWSAMGEEFGFIGCVAILAILAIFIILCLLVAKRSLDYLGKMIAIGIASMFMFQIFANVGVAMRILPNTGLPLPFISSGLSSLVTYMAAIGILINISIQPASKALGRGFLIKNEPSDISDINLDNYQNIV